MNRFILPFRTDYSEVTAITHTEDLIALTEYIQETLETEQVILLSYFTVACLRLIM